MSTLVIKNPPVPKPQQGETEQEFVSRCITTLEHEDPKRPHDQIQAICYSTWRENKTSKENAESLVQSVVERLNNVRQAIVEIFGDAGERFLEYTLTVLGVYDPKTKTYNTGLLKSEEFLPFVKRDGDKIEIGNMILWQGEFRKVDNESRVVAGYANTMTCDCVGDLMLPESYKQSVDNYDGTVFFMHHRSLPAGKITKSRIDEIGWYAESKPDEAYWKLVEKRVIKGYSIGGRITAFPTWLGNVTIYRTGVVIEDLSYVNNPCNKLSVISILGSKSSKVTVCRNEKPTVLRSDNAGKNKKEFVKMSTEENATTKLEESKTEEKKKTVVDMIQDLMQQMKEEGQQELFNALKKAKQVQDEAKEESRMTCLENKMGLLESSINEIKGMIDGLGGRIQKMEDEPEAKQTATKDVSPITPLDVVGDLVTQHGSDFQSAFKKMDQLVKENAA